VIEEKKDNVAEAITYEGEASLPIVKFGPKYDRCCCRIRDKSYIRQCVCVFSDRQCEELVKNHDAGIPCLGSDFKSGSNLQEWKMACEHWCGSMKSACCGGEWLVLTCFIHMMACALFSSLVKIRERPCSCK
jgi:hypothetical protein